MMLGLNKNTNTWTDVKRLVRKSSDAPCADSCPVTSTFAYDPNVDGIGTYKFRISVSDRAGNRLDPARSPHSDLQAREDALDSPAERGLQLGRLRQSRPEHGRGEGARGRRRAGVRSLVGNVPRRVQRSAGETCTSQSSYDWSRVDPIINRARARGLSITLGFDGPVPCWAIAELSDRDACQIRTAEGGGSCYHQPNLEYYAAWVTAVRDRYGATAIARWSPWNEPNLISHLEPQNRNGINPYSAAQHYRRLFFRARNVLGPAAALMFGDVTYSKQTAGVNGTPVDKFLGAAACAPGYDGCAGDVPGKIDAVELAFHDYVGANKVSGSGVNTPSDNKQHLQNAADLVDSEKPMNLRPALEDGLKWIAHTEGGVNSYGNYWLEDKQAAYLNCMEDNSWHQRKNTRFAQYLLQDPRPDDPHGGQTWSGLRGPAVEGEEPRGAEKLSYRAFRAPLTVRRTSAGIRVWGAWRPSPVPATLKLVARHGSTVIPRDIQLNGGHYFDQNLPLVDAPAGSKWTIEGPGATSRTVHEDDCSQ